ncbi:ribosomal L7Ae/L30e/S12e/Gadd45 family protein [Anaerovoracaceae bacterium 41-7]|jgi:ribosomal protein L7Ae-like RNA K-turn-binding protein|uniref:50S ribosomal protein L7ae n=1 Tax=Anaerotruncus colihominis TaxID=169435 RepID=A0A845QMA3_9FIRM|nr:MULTISPECIES: ribosomal L7Ae/L30e/S12e/Gadd45 family protein [Clostridia]MCI9475695.1 50S ribosomal protein L7ae [Emergencia sp.]MCI9638812.1 50S ribosomal protein L7ae [Emergencia sp.]NBH62554.1 50S ribosomal protein L7ae [Anaerotruncus colihominis]NCE97645.1 50S ribosomal protein L7ae [Emergencia sp. 1XD21-10]NCF03209.1 50S ribosomal protein L7ae [Anaerotruncus sp. 80]
MNRGKVFSYLGFAAKSRNLVTGYNTCIMMIEKRRVQLLILTEDLADNTVKKMQGKCEKNNVNYRIFGGSDELSQVTGKTGKGIFGITDRHFAEIICKEIDLIQSEREE